VSRYQKGKNQEGKTNLDLLEQEIVSGSGICWTISNLHLIPVRPTSHHSVFLRAGCPSCRPTNSVKALKNYKITIFILLKIVCCTLSMIQTLSPWPEP